METERLIIRKFSPEDWQDLFEYLSQEEVVKYEPYETFTEEASKQEAINRSNDDALFQRKGFATEASFALLDEIVYKQNARRIIAMCNPLNKSSWQLLERLGMRREGHLIQNIYFKKDESGNPIWSDTYEYGILTSEWKCRTK